MHKYLDKYEPAPPDRAKDTLPLFPFWEISAEEYAAYESHKWGCFSFDDYIYEAPDLNEWIHTLWDILFTTGAVKEIRKKYLTEDEIQEIEREKNEAL